MVESDGEESASTCRKDYDSISTSSTRSCFVDTPPRHQQSILWIITKPINISSLLL